MTYGGRIMGMYPITYPITMWLWGYGVISLWGQWYYRRSILYPIYEFKNERGGTAYSASPDEPPLVLWYNGSRGYLQKNREGSHASKSGNGSEKHMFELETSPWRYPYRGSAISREDPCSTSQDSVISSFSRDIPPIHKDGFSRYGQVDKIDPVSMW
ncbi:hypothetical protein NQ318_012648 [Aromia moschata]|uniref:Uncharacterized protein n=1 Tax=Aromia moschata TaxID=1265417 RepID=A0AAV8XBN2_9CUCU|nr:hypothetical protein NQ318_012648 [Aromia moschata]